MSKRCLLIVLMAIALILPRAIMSIEEIIDPFTFSTATLSQLYLDRGEIIIRPFDQPISPWQSHANDLSVRIVAPAFLTIVSQVTSVSLDALLYLPLNGVIFLLFAYVLGLVFSKSRLVATLYAAVMAFDKQIIGATNNTFYITLGYSLLMVFLILYLKSLESRTKGDIFLLIFCFVTLYFTYYSAEFFALAFSLGLFAIYAITKVKKKKNVEFSKYRDEYYRPFIYLPISFFVLFISFDTAVYQFFQIHGEYEPIVSYIGSRISGVLQLSYYVLLLIPIGIDFFFYITKKFTKHRMEAANGSRTGIKPTYLAFTFAAIAFSFIYMTFGFNIFSRAFHIFFPLLALYSIHQFRLRFCGRFMKYCSSILVILILLIPPIITGLFLQDPMHPYGPNQYSKISPSISFLVNNSDESKAIKMLSSLDITGYMFFRAMQLCRKSIYSYMFRRDVEILYSHDPEMVDDLFHAKSYDFLLLSREFERRVIFADGWYWAPIATEAFSLIITYTTFNKIYEDGQAAIFAYNR